MILAQGQILNGMTPDSPPADRQGADAGRVGSARTLAGRGKTGRVFTTTHGASEDLLERRIPADGGERVSLGRWGSRESIQPTATSVSSARIIRPRSDSAATSRA